MRDNAWLGGLLAAAILLSLAISHSSRASPQSLDVKAPTRPGLRTRPPLGPGRGYEPVVIIAVGRSGSTHLTFLVQELLRTAGKQVFVITEPYGRNKLPDVPRHAPFSSFFSCSFLNDAVLVKQSYWSFHCRYQPLLRGAALDRCKAHNLTEQDRSYLHSECERSSVRLMKTLRYKCYEELVGSLPMDDLRAARAKVILLVRQPWICFARAFKLGWFREKPIIPALQDYGAFICDTFNQAYKDLQGYRKGSWMTVRHEDVTSEQALTHVFKLATFLGLNVSEKAVRAVTDKVSGQSYASMKPSPLEQQLSLQLASRNETEWVRYMADTLPQCKLAMDTFRYAVPG
jgi:hypothetical protein